MVKKKLKSHYFSPFIAELGVKLENMFLLLSGEKTLFKRKIEFTPLKMIALLRTRKTNELLHQCHFHSPYSSAY